MKAVITFLISISILFSSMSADAKSADPVKDYIVGFTTLVDKSAVENSGGTIKHKFKHIPAAVVTLPDPSLLLNNPNVLFVEEDGKVKITGQSIPWGIEQIHAQEVQHKGVTGEGIKIGVIDTGIDYLHEDLKVISGVSTVPYTSDYMDDNGHGTHVAGVIGALDNDLGIVGTSPGAEIYAIKSLDQNGNGSISNVMAGIDWAVDNQMDILNMSFGTSQDSKALRKMLDEAYKKGILLIAAAGNNGFEEKGSMEYPALYKTVIAVGATDQSNRRAYFSSVGKRLELMAPGYEIYSTVPNGYAVMNGTSMATPYVSGAAALLWSHAKTLENKDIRELLSNTSFDLGDKFEYGYGLIDVNCALSSLN